MWNSKSKVVWVVAAFGLALCAEKPAGAFCLARQCDPDTQGAACKVDAMGCSTDGAALRRISPCVTFGVASGSAQRLLGITDVQFSQILAEAFALWTSVDCGGGAKPGLVVQTVGAVPSAGPFACLAVPENNLDVWSVNDTLPTPPVIASGTGLVAGRTTPTFTVPEGKVFDADVDLNELWFVLHNESPAALHALMRTVAAHEAGHALGLAHSPRPDALMFRSYEVTADRVPTPDDVQGICALFPPTAVTCASPHFPAGALTQAECASAAHASGGCTFANGTKPTPIGALAGLLVLVWGRITRGKMRRLPHNRNGSHLNSVV